MIKKTLKINSSKKLKKFYFFLPLYKSFLCRWITWEIITNDEQISKIKKALNIKSRKKRIIYIYDETCLDIDHKMSKMKNLCAFKNNQCRIQRCHQTKEINGCCKPCKYQSTKGCQTKNLICKLYFCREVRNHYDVVKFEDLKLLKMLSIRQRLVLKAGYFYSREDLLNDLFYGSLIAGIIRTYHRIFQSLKK